ncbi:L,D-transpeptidase [Streptomyces yaizuensis]|uniref:Ig-like domain-containing protein n=1 Tax=Streptomyces yaizuensis TaxID=2989713 RepID=A0ABQ5NX16_9ACTN|nr:Ig-like domain-containing protein [Streptomyces sp. YSPA8]GLF94764.1 Ig-like domain-containing protein [Streptomyces sp. YSPA8]
MRTHRVRETTAAVRGRRGAPARRLGAPLVLAALLLTACGPGGGGAGAASDAGARNAASRAVVTVAPKDGSTAVATSDALRITASDGRLTTVTVEDDRGNGIEGRIAADGGSWLPLTHLAAATRYRVHAVAEDDRGRVSAKDTSFTTLVPRDTFIAHHTPEGGAVVGVGMPVSLVFTQGITEPEAVERAVTVTADPPVEIAGHWFGDNRLDFRPERYWRPGTEVTVRIGLDGVQGRPGVHGTQSKTFSFTVGRAQVSTVDAAVKTMEVRRDGRPLRTLAVTAGAPATTTYNGVMVIGEKHRVTRMNGATVGFGGEYDIKDVPHALRLSASGTFVHGDYWSSPGTFGTTNVSHGSVGLRDVRGGGDRTSPAAWFYENSLLGDVVVVKNSQDGVIAPENGLNGWNMTWAEWKR